jgi:tetratricopeptide (TPR) repeat protein
MASPTTRPATWEQPTPVRELLDRAELLLAGGELDSYDALFGSLAGVEDSQRRYWAATRMIELGLAAARGDRPSGRAELLGLLAGRAVEELEREPSEPVLLVHAGVIFSELGSLGAAEALLRAAGGLAPELEAVTIELAALQSRGPLGGDQAPPSLSRRAQEVAAQAKPAAGLRLSLCMIVRDEQEMLPRCLSAVAGAVDEIVVVDTGSSDATIEIARSFGALVIEHQWSDSFAEARNVSFDAALGEWLMFLDADEVLASEDVPLLRSLTGRTWREAFYLRETNHTGELGGGSAVTHNALRVLRNRPEYRFEGRVHEQIAHRLPTYLPERLEVSEVRVEHFGYLSAVRAGRNKSVRNIELLSLQQAESSPSAFLHYNLGSEHAASGDILTALAELERAWALLEKEGWLAGQEFLPALASRLVKALRACDRPAEAILRAEEGLERLPGFTDLVLEQALAATALGEGDRAIELMRRCIEMGEAPGRYASCMGAGTFLPRTYLAEILLDRGDLQEGIELLETCLRAYPDFLGSIKPYVAALLAQGADGQAVVAGLEVQMPSPTPAARLELGSALHEGGADADAEIQLRAALEGRSSSSRARVALGEALLAQRRYAEAAAVTAEVPCEDALAASACRTELFALIAGGEEAGLPAALERARAAAMPAAEVELLSAWSQIAANGETAFTVSGAAVGLLEVMLETLLRVQDFQAFEVLLGVLERAPLSERERRELLAGIYLRRGYATSAAEEWMAVCREEPDASALLGLAQVALSRGMSREAAEFAAAALSHDPHNEGASHVLSQLQDAPA